MAIGVDNPKKPGETVWLFKFEDLKEVIPDDIYEAINELCEVDEVEDLRDEIEGWERWQAEYFHDEESDLEEIWEELDRMWEKINYRSKKLDRGDLISGFKVLRELVQGRLKNF